MTKCNNGVRAATGQPYGCLTMFNTSNDTVTMLEPYLGDATGIAAVTGLNKIYTAEGGQVYIYTTTDGIALDNQYVTVTGTAYDVAYMDAPPTPTTPSTEVNYRVAPASRPLSCGRPGPRIANPPGAPSLIVL